MVGQIIHMTCGFMHTLAVWKLERVKPITIEEIVDENVGDSKMS